MAPEDGPDHRKGRPPPALGGSTAPTAPTPSASQASSQRPPPPRLLDRAQTQVQARAGGSGSGPLSPGGTQRPGQLCLSLSDCSVLGKLLC